MRRTTKIIAAVVAVVLMAGAAIAAVLLLRGPLGGQAEIAATPRLEWTSNAGEFPAEVLDTDMAHCDITIMGRELVDLDLLGHAGSFCDFSARLYAISHDETQAVLLQGISFAEGLSAELLPDFCGVEIIAGDPGTEVQFRLTMPEDEVGTVIPAASDAGVVGTYESAHDPALCATVTP